MEPHHATVLRAIRPRLGRPLRRIAGKERELRAVLDSTGEKVSPAVTDLLDEIERQTPNFRLMLANIQVLVQLESPDAPQEPAPVEPSEVVRRIADRYTPVASETGKEVSWWAEPAEFGIVYTDTNAMEHVVTNLVDNAVRFASHHVEVRLSRNSSHFSCGSGTTAPASAPNICLTCSTVVGPPRWPAVRKRPVPGWGFLSLGLWLESPAAT